jgi:hypothetical protein
LPNIGGKPVIAIRTGKILGLAPQVDVVVIASGVIVIIIIPTAAVRQCVTP